MTSIGFVTQDWSFATDSPSLGGAGHYRLAIPAAALAAQGYDVSLGALIGAKVNGSRHPALGVLPPHLMEAEREEQLAAASWPDVLVMQRVMLVDVIEHVREARLAGQRIVQDIDDWFGGLPTSNRAFQATHVSRNAEANVSHYFGVLAASDLVIASTPYLAERVERRCGRPTVVCRNAIDLDRWTIERPQREPPVLGWVGALTHRAYDLEQLRGLLGQVLGHGYAERFHHSGWSPFTKSAAVRLGLPHDAVTTVGMASIEDYPHLLKFFDVCVVPLDLIPFNRAKSAIKGMEYAASSIPFVASASDEYRYLHDEYGIGRVALRTKDWLRHLRELADPEVRAKEARVQRERVAALDIKRRWHDWAEVLESVVPTA